MKDSTKALLGILGVSTLLLVAVLLGASLKSVPSSEGESFGGTVYNRIIEFSEGITVDSTTVIDGSGNIDAPITSTTGTFSSTLTVTGLLTGNGDALFGGTTPEVTIGDAGTEDAQVTFDGAAQDFYIGLEDVTDDLVLGVGSTLGTTVALAIDQNQLVTVSAGITMIGTTPTLTVGDAGAEDTSVVFDGIAQDFYMGLEDATDNLVFGLGSVLGTSLALSIDQNLLVTVANDFTVSATTTLSGGLDINSADGSLTGDAITQNVNLGKFSDTADIAAGADRTAITLTNSKITTTSFLLFSMCSTPDSGATLTVSATPTAGAATVQVSNEGAGNQTANWSVCYLVSD